MPFGAECFADTVRFRLWAPRAKEVRLLLREKNEGSNRELPMKSESHGWFELVTDAAHPGSLYQFRIDGECRAPDPASRFQPEDVHGFSEVVDGCAFQWEESTWRGRPWFEAVMYELHVGTFSADGTFAGVEAKLDYLHDLGVTAVELMPLSDFSGKRNWGYDGVLPYAPDSSYGRPDDLKRLIQAAHKKGLMMFLDVVYNHFGPDGNYLRLYAPDFFTDRHATPWGEAINFDGPQSRTVRDYFIHNALYWLEEYQFDGLRLDAVHAIADDSKPDILTELAQKVKEEFEGERHVHLVLENEKNEARYLRCDKNRHTKKYDAQWNDDIHHTLHVLITKETDGYYSDYEQSPLWQLGRCLAEGFAFQGDSSEYRHGAKRGEISRDLPPTCFVTFLQNHDQVGNRAFGDRITENAPVTPVRAAMAILLLAPSPPLLFIGQEFGAKTPFLFFSDFKGELAKAVTEGRRNEFKSFAKFADAAMRAQIPDPNEESTFVRSKLDWGSVEQPDQKVWLEFHRSLLSVRHKFIVPLMQEIIPGKAGFHTFHHSGLAVEWNLSSGRKLQLTANMGDREIAGPWTAGETIYRLANSPSQHGSTKTENVLEPWSVIWQLES
jgi:malto-oligosyltrehalose trehalohydrolase